MSPNLLETELLEGPAESFILEAGIGNERFFMEKREGDAIRHVLV